MGLISGLFKTAVSVVCVPVAVVADVLDTMGDVNTNKKTHTENTFDVMKEGISDTFDGDII